MKLKHYIFALGLMSSLGACNDDFMERYPLDVPTDETFWTSESDLKLFLNKSSTFLRSSLRSSPLSTNTHVSWSPIALWISAAATEESTPPLSPRITFLSPTVFLIFSIARST